MSVDVTSLPLEVWGGQGSYLHGDSDDIISCLPLLITPSSIGVTKVTCRCTRAHTHSHTHPHTNTHTDTDRQVRNTHTHTQTQTGRLGKTPPPKTPPTTTYFLLYIFSVWSAHR